MTQILNRNTKIYYSLFSIKGTEVSEQAAQELVEQFNTNPYACDLGLSMICRTPERLAEVKQHIPFQFELIDHVITLVLETVYVPTPPTESCACYADTYDECAACQA